MAHYFVTGGSGWLGKAVIDRLSRGFPDYPELDAKVRVDSITALVLPEEERRFRESYSELNVVAGDLRSASDCARFFDSSGDAILLHLAGLIHPKLFTRDFQAINVDGSKNVISAAARNGVRRAVVMSSNSPIGCNRTTTDLFDEESPYNPYMGYGKSKMLLEQYVHEVQSQGELQTVLIRGPWFYGPFQPDRQTVFFEMIRDGKAPIVGNGENVRSMVHVDNLAQGLMRAAVHPNANGQTYWIADDRPYTMNEIINTVEYLLAYEFDISCNFGRLKLPSIASGVAYMCDAMLQSVGLYHQKIHVLSEMNKNIACDVSKAKRELRYVPGVALEEGMRQSIEHLIGRGLLKV